MTLSREQLEKVVSELSVLCGGRVQRVDLVAEREVVLEVRVPGRTMRMLVSARPGLGRVHLVDKRPPREVFAGPVQAKLRQRLAGQLLMQLSSEGRTLHIDVPTARWSVRLDGGRDAFRILPPVLVAPREEGVAVPETFAISDTIAERYQARIPEATDRFLRDRLVALIDGRKKKSRRLAINIDRDISRLERMKADGEKAELMKSALHEIPRGATEIELTDWTTGQPIRIVLDPALGPKANMARFFNRSKKATRGLPIARKRRADVQRRLDELEAERAEVLDAKGETLERLARGDAASLGGIDGRRMDAPTEKPARSRPVDKWARTFNAVDGTIIRVGRGAKENDRLSLSYAKAADIWLHARGTSGAHVVVENRGNKAPSQEAILDAAHLAVFYSSAKNETKAEVIYTEARHVKKTKGAPPGRVGVGKGKTMLVRMDRTRLARLLNRPDPTL